MLLRKHKPTSAVQQFSSPAVPDRLFPISSLPHRCTSSSGSQPSSCFISRRYHSVTFDVLGYQTNEQHTSQTAKTSFRDRYYGPNTLVKIKNTKKIISNFLNMSRKITYFNLFPVHFPLQNSRPLKVKHKGTC